MIHEAGSDLSRTRSSPRAASFGGTDLAGRNHRRSFGRWERTGKRNVDRSTRSARFAEPALEDFVLETKTFDLGLGEDARGLRPVQR
jgi:hypothetical protein